MGTVCRMTVVVLCLGLAMSCVTGCGKTPEETGGQLDVTENRTADSLMGAGADRTSIDAAKNKVPTKSIPKDMPIYTGAKVEQKTGLLEADSLMVLLQTADPIDKVTAFYKERCPAAGWTEVGNMADPSGKVMQLITYTKDDRQLSVTIVNNQTENFTDITLVSATLNDDQPESARRVTAYFPAQRRRSSSTGNKTDGP